MKKLICLLFLIPLLLVSCKKDGGIVIKPSYYRTYEMNEGYTMINLTTNKPVSNVTGNLDFNENTIDIRIIEKGIPTIVKHYDIRQVYDFMTETYYLYEGNNKIGFYIQKGKANSTKDIVQLNFDSIETIDGKKVMFLGAFF